MSIGLRRKSRLARLVSQGGNPKAAPAVRAQSGEGAMASKRELIEPTEGDKRDLRSDEHDQVSPPTS